MPVPAGAAFGHLPAPSAHGPVRRGVEAVVATPIMTLPLLAVGAVLAATAAGAATWTRLRVGRPIARRPWASIGVATAGAVAVDLLAPAGPVGAVGVALATVLLGGAWALAVGALSAAPTSLEGIEAACAERWPERWLRSHLRNPIDAYLVRFAIVGLSPLLPLAGALALRGACCSGLLWVALVAASGAQETLAHIDLHQRIFRPPARSGWSERLVLGGLSRVVEWAVPLANLLVPGWYREQHRLHHASNGSVDDPQATVAYDRTSYVDFCRAGLKFTLDVTFGTHTLTHLAGRGKGRAAGRLLLGLAVSWTCFALVAARFPLLAATLVVFRTSTGIAFAVTTWTEHGLVDPRDPTNVLRNTTDTLGADQHGSFGQELHLQHTLRPGRHWSRSVGDLQADQDLYRDHGVILLELGSLAFSGLVLSRQFERLSRHVQVASRTPLTDDQVVAVLRERTTPLRGAALPRWADRLDRAASSAMGRFLVGLSAVAGAPVPPIQEHP